VVARELKDWVKTDVALLANMPTTSRNSSSLMLARNKSQKNSAAIQNKENKIGTKNLYQVIILILTNSNQ